MPESAESGIRAAYGVDAMTMAFRTAACGLALLGIFMLSSSVMAQPPGGRGFRGPGGPGFFGGGTLGLMQIQEVQREIELSEDQQAELRSLGETVRDEIGQEMQGMFQGMRDLSDEERQARFAEIGARMQEINRGVEKRMQKVLLPHQYDRVKQIELQSRLQLGGAAALTEGELAETLGLTEDQREQIREKSEEVQRDLNDKINQLRVEARNQLLEVLTPEQRAKLESMMGSEFTLPTPQFNQPGGPGGFRGRNFGFGGPRNRDRANPPATESNGD
jgi:Spy/CpxP family protein refolding chaperone